MNCKKTRELIDDALDRRLTGAVKRGFDSHISHCCDCRRLYDAEKAEHARWVRAMNDTSAEPPHALPPDFADRLVAAVGAGRTGFSLSKWLMRIAASLAVAAGVAFAAERIAVAVRATTGGQSSPTADTVATSATLPATGGRLSPTATTGGSMSSSTATVATSATLPTSGAAATGGRLSSTATTGGSRLSRPTGASTAATISTTNQQGENEMNIKSMSAPVAAAAIALAASASALDYPVYTVTAEGNGTTYLASSDVEVIESAGADPQTVAFSSLTPTTGTFRKIGNGYLESASGLSGFTGSILVEEGVFVVTGPGQLGANDVDDVHNRANIVVSKDATLVFDIAANTGDRFRQSFNIAGEGFNGLGAIRILSVGNRSNNDVIGAGSITADTNATICIKHGVRVQFAYENFDLNWWTLTIKAVDRESNVWSYLDMTQPKIDDPGSIVVDGLDWRTWVGIANTTKPSDVASAKNTPTTLKLENESWLFPNGFPAQYTLADGTTVPWILNATAGKMWLDANNGWGSTNALAWAGPVELSGSLSVRSGDGGAQSFTFPDGLCGDGSLTVTMTNTQVNLVAPKNDFYGVLAGNDDDGWRTDYVHSNFYGSVSLNTNSELRVFWPRALEATASNVTLNASGMSLAYCETYDLPPLTFDVPGGETKSFAGGTNGFVRSLLKTGPGTLDMTAQLTVTGVTEIAEGTLRVPCDKAGLTHGWYVIPSGQYGTDHVSYLTTVCTNCVELGTELAYTGDLERWKRSNWDNMIFMYGGWIWNRTDSNQDWTIASQLMRGSLVYIDGQRLATSPNGWENGDYWTQSSDGKIRYGTVKDVTPGPHRIDIRIYTGADKYTYSTIANAWNGGLSALKGVKNWTDPLFGLGIDRQGRGPDGDGNIDFNNLEKIVDPGDGSFLTVTTNTLDGVVAHTPQFKRLRFSGGSLDARGGSLDIDDIEIADEASAAIVNSNAYYDDGVVTVAGALGNTWRNVLDGRTLTVAGKLVFGNNATVRIADIKNNLPHGKYVLAVATGGVEGRPQFVDEDKTMQTGWHTKLADVEGEPGKKRLELNWRIGLAVFFQ